MKFKKIIPYVAFAALLSPIAINHYLNNNSNIKIAKAATVNIDGQTYNLTPNYIGATTDESETDYSEQGTPQEIKQHDQEAESAANYGNTLGGPIPKGYREYQSPYDPYSEEFNYTKDPVDLKIRYYNSNFKSDNSYSFIDGYNYIFNKGDNVRVSNIFRREGKNIASPNSSNLDGTFGITKAPKDFTITQNTKLEVPESINNSIPVNITFDDGSLNKPSTTYNEVLPGTKMNLSRAAEESSLKPLKKNDIITVEPQEINGGVFSSYSIKVVPHEYYKNKLSRDLYQNRNAFKTPNTDPVFTDINSINDIEQEYYQEFNDFNKEIKEYQASIEQGQAYLNNFNKSLAIENYILNNEISKDIKSNNYLAKLINKI